MRRGSLMMRHTFGIPLLISLCFLRASAQDHYIVRAPGWAIQQIASRNGVTVVKSLTSSAEGLHVMRVPMVWNAAKIVQNLKSEVQWVEHDDALAVPEATASGPQLRGHSGYLPLTDFQNMVGYYGTFAWGAYVNQPAASLIRVSESHRLRSEERRVGKEC